MVTCNDLLGTSVVIWGDLTLYALFLLTPPVLFLCFLLWKLPSAVRILRETPIGVRLFRASALAFLWLICFVNIGRVSVQVLIPLSLDHLWKSSWLLMRFMLMFCQAAVAVFIFILILHDLSFERIISNMRMDRSTKRLLIQTFTVASVISTIDCAIQAVLMFCFDEGIYSTDDTSEEGALYWIIRAIICIIMYLGLLLLLCLFMPMQGNTISETKNYWWYGTQIFPIYCWVLLTFHAMDLLGWSLIVADISIGECFIGLEMFLYYSLFPPLVYLVFMAKFFQTAEHWPLIRGGPGWNLDEKADENDPETQRRLERRLELQRWMAEQEQKHRATNTLNENEEDSELVGAQAFLLPTIPSAASTTTRK